MSTNTTDRAIMAAMFVSQVLAWCSHSGSARPQRAGASQASCWILGVPFSGSTLLQRTTWVMVSSTRNGMALPMC